MFSSPLCTNPYFFLLCFIIYIIVAPNLPFPANLGETSSCFRHMYLCCKHSHYRSLREIDQYFVNFTSELRPPWQNETLSSTWIMVSMIRLREKCWNSKDQGKHRRTAFMLERDINLEVKQTLAGFNSTE